MAWIYLFIAGLLEIVWALALKFTQGFTRLVPSLITLAALFASLLLLARATRTLPLGTAYAVWVGIGATGAALGGILIFGESTSAPRLFFLALLIVGIVGLRLSS